LVSGVSISSATGYRSKSRDYGRLKPELPIWTRAFRIICFPDPLHKEFATKA
jgi:hypothetical protein